MILKVDACVNVKIVTVTNVTTVSPYQSLHSQASPRIDDHIYLKEIKSPTPKYGDAFELRIYNGDYFRNIVQFSLFEVLPMEKKLSKLYRIVVRAKQGSKEATCIINIFQQLIFEMEPWDHYTWQLFPASV